MSELDLGARDLFVFRRVEDHRFVHVGGSGRGEGWAGIVEVSDTEPPQHVWNALTTGRPVRVGTPLQERIFGPYFARSALIVPLGPDLVVVLGSPDGPLEEIDDATAMDLALCAAEGIEAVSPAKRLADELELLHAIKGLMSFEPTDLPETMAHVADQAAAALSCEIGVLYVHDDADPRLAVAERGFAVADRDAVLRVMRTLAMVTPDDVLPVCEQDARSAPLPAPFRFEDGVRSWYLLRVPGRRQGLLLLLHTEACPRGFTRLCQELGARMADSAEALLRTAESRLRLEHEINRVALEARRDALTGVGNLLAWREALDGAPAQSAIVIIDLDHLKDINDAAGHDAGDEHIRATSEILRAAAGGGNVARIGGDEFGVLVPPGADAADFVSQIEAAASALPPIAGWGLSFASGVAVAEVDEPLADAQRRADKAMYAAKRRRRAMNALGQTVARTPETGRPTVGTTGQQTEPAALDPGESPVWFGVGAGSGEDAWTVGNTAAATAVAGRDAQLLVVFASDTLNLPKLLAGIGAACPGPVVVGCTTAGEISSGGPADDGVVVTALGGTGLSVSGAVAQAGPAGLRAASVEASALAARGVRDLPHRVLLLLTDGLGGDQQEVVRGAYGVVGASVPLVGGCAGDGLKMRRTFQFFGEQVLTDSIIAVSISSTTPLGIGVRHGWRQVGEPMLVTASTDNRVLTLNDEPALDVYLDRLGAPSEVRQDAAAFTRFAMTHPLGLSRRSGEEVRFVAGADFNARSLLCIAEVPQGGLTRFMEGDAESVLAATDAACADAFAGLGGRPPIGAIAFDCIARRGVLGDAGIADEVGRITTLGGGAPVAGFYTYGEIARTTGINGFHNQTLVVLAFQLT